MVLTGNTGNNYNQVDTRNLMNKCQITQYPYDMQPGSVLTEPFFSSNSYCPLSERKQGMISEQYNNFMEIFPVSLRQFYQYIGDDRTELQCERWTFLKLTEIYNRSDIYTNMLDIAVKYNEMGHVFILSLDRKTNNFFIRCDGGCNGYEREHYFDHYVDLDTDNINNEQKFVDFDRLFLDMYYNQLDDNTIWQVVYYPE